MLAAAAPIARGILPGSAWAGLLAFAVFLLVFVVLHKITGQFDEDK